MCCVMGYTGHDLSAEKFKEYLLRSNQPVNFKFEGVEYSITIEELPFFRRATPPS